MRCKLSEKLADRTRVEHIDRVHTAAQLASNVQQARQAFPSDSSTANSAPACIWCRTHRHVFRCASKRCCLPAWAAWQQCSSLPAPVELS